LACATTEPAGSSSGVAPTTTAAQPQESPRVTPIRIRVSGRQLDAHLSHNPTAEALLRQLPLTLAFRDLNDVEKIAGLPEPLTTKGVPEGADPDVADIGYYATSNDLVFYYGDVGYWNGIVRIGQLNPAVLDYIAGQPDGFEVKIERS
jgi:hypothetical protein